MARLESQRKGGFYPCPSAVVDIVADRLVPPAGRKFNVLDPCAGKGAALEALADKWFGAVPYAIEVEVSRGEECAERIGADKTLAPCDIFAARMTAGSMSLLWLNPPYDTELGGGGQTQHRFLMHAHSWLAVGGVLCYVVPEYTVGPSSPSLKYLHVRYDKLAMMPFPAAERRFKEVVVFGVKRQTMRAIDRYEEDYPPLIGQLGEYTAYQLPAGSGPPKTWEKTRLTDDEVGAALDRSPLQRFLRPPPPLALARPPLPPKKGHMAVLLSAGHLNGAVFPPGEEPHVIRGACKKETYVKEETITEQADGTEVLRKVEGEKFVMHVRAVDAAGTFHELKGG